MPELLQRFIFGDWASGPLEKGDYPTRQLLRARSCWLGAHHGYAGPGVGRMPGVPPN